jgi:hypothetical protein
VFHEPPLQRAYGRDNPRGHPLEQKHADQTGAPSRVLAAQPQGGLNRDGGLDRGVRGTMVRRFKAVLTTVAESRQEPANGGARKSERGGDLVGLTALLPETKRGLANRNRYGAWHRYGSQGVHYLNDQPLLYHCPDAIKPGVAIRRSNLVSRDNSTAPWNLTYSLTLASPS